MRKVDGIDKYLIAYDCDGELYLIPAAWYESFRDWSERIGRGEAAFDEGEAEKETELWLQYRLDDDIQSIQFSEPELSGNG
jgi:hypothetical protein